MSRPASKDNRVTIRTNGTYNANTLLVYFNKTAFSILNMYEIVFDERKLKITEPLLHSTKIYSINKTNHGFGFGAKHRSPEELVGTYTLEKLEEGEFVLNKV